MNERLRVVVLGLLALALAGAGWRIFAHAMADTRAEAAPESALRWIHGHPGALLQTARRQADAGQWEAAAASARGLLKHEPLQGGAWTVLGQAAEAGGDPVQAAEAYAKAVDLTPRDAGARSWLAQRKVAEGDFPAALAHLDALMRTHQPARGEIFTYMAQLSDDSGFRQALVAHLMDGPDWRPQFLHFLQNKPAAAAASDDIHGDLLAAGVLSQRESEAWIESMLQRGHWSRAYAYWVGTLPAGTPLPAVFNGNFVRRPSGWGFDWRTPATPGVGVQFPLGDGARISYRNRRIDNGGLEQILLLAPGRYTLQARMRTEDLRADRGLQWVVQCAGNGQELGATAPIPAGRGTVQAEASIQVPDDCPAQRLRLRNAARVPALQTLGGEVVVNAVAIVPDTRPLPEPEPAGR